MISSPFLAFLITFILAILWLRLLDFLAHRGFISSVLSRKIIHTGTGIIFILCWLLFPVHWISRWLAASIPLLITIQFILIGFGILKDPQAVEAMTRTGNPREILKGPLYYGIAFVLVTLLYWKSSPIGILGLIILSAGDGFADIIGRTWGNLRLAWNQDKSWIGSIAMFSSSLIFCSIILSLFYRNGIFFQPDILKIGIIVLVSTLVESLPFRNIDNLTIVISALVTGHIIYYY